ncbi:MAG: hypothetical protein IJ305_00520 [Oscillospiraceae bacterium]|nr:hypothetical protein [Oscillospiraceae bacterium]
MNFRKIHASKILTAAMTGAFALSVMSVTASAESIGSASIYLADETWSSQVYWGNGTEGKETIGIASVNPAEITGDGTYTTSVEFEKAMDYGFFFCLSSDIKGTGNGSFADYPDAEMSIMSVKADGKEVSGNTSISDINDNGYMKINIFDPLTDADGNYADSLDWTSGIKSMEVTFTVTGTGILSAEAPEEDGAAENQPAEGQPSDGTEADGDSPADAPESGNAEESVPADDNTEAPDTGNSPISPMAAVTALAAVIAFMAKKK